MSKEDALDTFASLLNLLIIVGTIYGVRFLFINVPIWLRKINHYDNSLLSKILLFLAIVLLGFLFFIFKQRAQYRYGICETTFAITSTWFACDKLLTNVQEKSAWLTVVGSIYLIVRGLSNIKEAKEKKKQLKLANTNSDVHRKSTSHFRRSN